MESKKYKEYFDNLLDNMLEDNMLEGAVIHQMIYDSNNIAIDYKILKINKSYEKILGLFKNNVEGKLASEVYGEILLLDIYSNVVLNKEPIKFDFYYEPMKKHFSISSAPWNNTGFITIFFDITNVVKNNNLLKSKEKLYYGLFENSKSIKMLIDPYTCKIEDINKKAIDFYGYNKEDFLKKSINDINILDKNCFKNIINETLNKKENIILLKHKLNNNIIKDVEIDINLVDIDNKKLFNCIIYDITDIKKSKVDLLNSERRLLKAELISKTGNWELNIKNNIVKGSNDHYQNIEKC